jgi:transglutaminase-like putative cysteine protease
MTPKTLAHLPRDTRDTLFMLVVICAVALPLASQVPLWCSLMCAAVILWRGALAWRGQPLPRTAWRVGLLALAVVATLLSYRTLLGRDAGVTLVVVLLALKTLELRARRDAFVVFFLSFFLILTQFFYSQSLLTALVTLLALWGLLTALVNAHMPVGKPPLSQAARIAGGMTLLGAPIMLVLFMLFPRLAPLWGMPGDAMAGRSGLSASMTVGNIATLALDDSVAMRVRFDGPVPPQASMYFRGPVLNEFDGQRWSATPWLDQPWNAPKPQLTVQSEPISYQVTLEPNQQPWLLTLDATLQAPQVQGRRPRQTPDMQWLLTHPVTELLRYQVQSHTDYQADVSLLPAQLRRSLVLPPDANPRTWLWAQELRQTHPDPAARVDAVLTHLRTGGYSYTLEPGAYGRDSADEFWFDRKLGFCEHMAAGFVIVMRASGVPARVVTGYQGGERNTLDGFWTVRQSDAHAWAEVWLSGRGWVRVDPTSAVSPGRTGTFTRLQTPRGAVASALLGTVSPEVALSLRAAWDAVNNRWNQWVLNYTQTRQLDLLKRLGFESPSWEDLIYLLCAMVVVASLAGALWSAWERQHQDPWLRMLARARQKMTQAGLAVPAQSTPRQLVQLLKSQPDARQQRTSFQAWLLRLEAVRYARADSIEAKSGIHSASFKRQIATLEREFRSLLPLRPS